MPTRRRAPSALSVRRPRAVGRRGEHRFALAASLALALAAALAVAGCAHAVAVGRSRTIYVTLADYRLRPAEMRATAGRITLIVHNLGRLSHNLAVIAPRTRRTVAATPAVPPGHSSMLVVRLAPGRYATASTIGSDEDLGDHGTLVVTR